MLFILLRRYLSEPIALFLPALVTVSFIAAPHLGMFFGIPMLAIGALVVPSRPTVHETTLPIDARTIVLARILSRLAFTWIPLAIWVAVLRMRGLSGIEPWMIPDAFSGAAWNGFREADVFLLLSIVSVLPLSIRPNELSPPSPISPVLAEVGLCVVAFLIFRVMPPQVSPILLAICFVGIVTFTWWKAGRGLLLASDRVADDEAQLDFPSTASNELTAPTVWHFVKPLWVRLPRRTLAFSFVMLATMGMLNNWLIFFGMMFLSIPSSMRQFTMWLRPFPISNRNRFLIYAVPVLLSTLGALATGRTLARLSHIEFLDYESAMNSGPYKSSGSRKFESLTNVSLTYWDVTSSGALPTITAPWGETTIADTISYLGSTFYNPYATGAQNSVRFDEWQLQRATQAVFGKAIATSNYDIHAKLPLTVEQSPRMIMLSSATMLIFALAWLLLTEIPYWFRVLKHNWLMWSSALIGFAISMLITYFDMFRQIHRGRPMVAPLVQRNLLQLSRALPDNNVVVVLIVAVPIVILYFLLERQFARSEWIPRVVTTRTGTAR